MRLLRDLLGVVGDALPVDLLVVQDVDALDALILHVGDLRRALDGVGGHDAAVGALTGRVVLLGLALVGALAAGQADVGVRRGDLQDAGLVEDRDRDRGRARVELAEVGDRVLVADRLAGVLGDLAGLPLAGRRSGVVKRDVLDREIAGLAAGLLQGQLLAADDVLRLRATIALQRQATNRSSASCRHWPFHHHRRRRSSSPHAATPNAMAARGSSRLPTNVLSRGPSSGLLGLPADTRVPAEHEQTRRTARCGRDGRAA